MSMKDKFYFLGKIGDLAEDLQEAWNGEVARYKRARAELERIDAEQAELWLSLVKNLRDLDRLNARLKLAGCVTTADRDEDPIFTEDVRKALGKSGVDGFEPGVDSASGGGTCGGNRNPVEPEE